MAVAVVKIDDGKGEKIISISEDVVLLTAKSFLTKEEQKNIHLVESVADLIREGIPVNTNTVQAYLIGWKNGCSFLEKKLRKFKD